MHFGGDIPYFVPFRNELRISVTEHYGSDDATVFVPHNAHFNSDVAAMHYAQD